jgi:hypothetical protein
MVTLPHEVQNQLTQLANAGPQAAQQGGIIALAPAGGARLAIQGSGQAVCFAPDFSIAPDLKPLGVVHTHLAPGGGMSFSGGDIVAMLNGQAPIEIVQGHADQFLLLRTGQTPAQMNRAQVEAAYQGRVVKCLAAGKTLPEATRDAAVATAALCKLAYYEGKDGSLRRVAPS